MSQFILIDHIKVQNANAIGGFTWGFPAITNFLGFVHNLSRKLVVENIYKDIALAGCVLVAHEHQVHTYRSDYDLRFTQTRNAPYLHGLAAAKKSEPPPIIEEGKMNMTVSLLISCEGNIGNRADGFRQWLKRACFLQRLAGGTILDIANISLHTPENSRDVRLITRKLLPGFVLRDRSQYLADHYQDLIKKKPDAELLDAWLDFSALKQKARPKSDLITKYLQKLIKADPENIHLIELWQEHLAVPYGEHEIPGELKDYFSKLIKSSQVKPKLQKQWQEYCHPDEKTKAHWEYTKKPQSGYLVPIMTGYKAISQIYKNAEVSNTRDSETDVCFVESAHTIGEWQSAHHLRTPEQLQECLWHYHHEENWYLCKQGIAQQIQLCNQTTNNYEEYEDDIYN